VELCLPPPDEFSSCEDLMSNLVLRICVWVLGVLATFGNILVIGWRIRFKHTNQVTKYLKSPLKRVQLEYTGKITKSTHFLSIYFIPTFL
jgi:hypothetical protein